MKTELRNLIDSARRQVEALESSNPAEAPPKEPVSDKRKRLHNLESARQLRAWADFAERGMA